MTNFELIIILVVWLILFPFCLWFPSRADSRWYRRLRGGVWVCMYGYWHQAVQNHDWLLQQFPSLCEDHRRKK